MRSRYNDFKPAAAKHQGSKVPRTNAMRNRLAYSRADRVPVTPCPARSAPEPTALNSRFRIRSPAPQQASFFEKGQSFQRLPFLLSQEQKMSAKENVEALIRQAKNFWLMKSEPGECSIDDALAAPDHKVSWFGVRNYQARNFMRDAMKPGDAVLFYHSSCPNPGIAGIARIASGPYPDACQFDESSEYFDPKSTSASPRWVAVDVEGLVKIPVIPIAELRPHPELSEMVILRRGNRLSITPVTKAEFCFITENLASL